MTTKPDTINICHCLFIEFNRNLSLITYTFITGVVRNFTYSPFENFMHIPLNGKLVFKNRWIVWSFVRASTVK